MRAALADSSAPAVSFSKSGVRMCDGQTALTRIRRGASSTANARTAASSAPFPPAEREPPGQPADAETDDTATAEKPSLEDPFRESRLIKRINAP